MSLAEIDRPEELHEASGHPIFELSEEGGRHIKIYANGVVEGCKAERIVNHIKGAIRPQLWAFFSKFEPRPNWRGDYREFTAEDYAKMVSRRI